MEVIAIYFSNIYSQYVGQCVDIFDMFFREQFILWTQLPEKSIRLFTSEKIEQLPPKGEPCVVITTFSMMCFSGRRSAEADRMLTSIKEREWGLMLLDEVHVAPAAQFRRVLELVLAKFIIYYSKL